MLPQECDDAQILVGLGLTRVQAEVYLTLAKIGKGTIKSISNTAKIDRANAYRVIQKLEELNLVEKVLTTPTIFMAVPLQEGIEMLLGQKSKAYQEIEVKTKELLQRCKDTSKETPLNDEYEFIMLSASSSLRKLNEMFGRLQEIHELIIYWDDLKPLLDWSINNWRTFLKKGIKIKLITYMQEEETMPTNLLALKKYPLFEIRRMSTPPTCTLTIFDERESLISTMPHAPLCPSLWVNNPNVVSVFQNNFDQIWGKSKDCLAGIR